MNTENIDKVYELLEQFDFTDLSDQEQKEVLESISESEYNSMRQTLKEVCISFSIAEDPILEELVFKPKKESFVMLFLKQPIPLYKVAAIILITLGISLITNRRNPLQTRTSNEFVYVHHTDTVYSKIIDTIKIVKEKIVRASLPTTVMDTPKIAINFPRTNLPQGYKSDTIYNYEIEKTSN